jgi:Transposase IS116/IS110/IS902 family
VLADRGIGEDRILWTGSGRAWLADLELPSTPRAIIQDCGGLLDALAAPIARLEREIAGLAKPDPRIQALMVLPGVGKLTAMTLVAEIGDIARFPTARKLCAWAGLTPQVRNSDRKVRHGHITKQGSPWVRGILQEAAHTAKRSPQFAGTYAQLARRRGTQIATVAIARRLLARSFHLLKEVPTAAATTGEGQTGRARVSACACNTAVDLTAQPGPDAIVMRTPPRARMGACEPTPTEVVRVFSPPNPAPVLAGVKVVRPPGRSTLTPTVAGGPSHHEKPANKPTTGAGSACALDRARPHGSGNAVGTAVSPSILARRR